MGEAEERGRVLLSRTSIRTQMFASALLMLAPMLAFAAFQIYSEATGARRDIETLTSAVASVNAAEIAHTLDTSRGFLQRLAENPDIRGLDPRHCGNWFSRFQEIYPYYSHLITSDLNGVVVCSSLPRPKGPRRNIDNYLPKIKETDSFSIAKPALSPLTGRWVVPLDVPLHDDSGALVGTIAAPLDLIRFNPFVGPEAFRGLPEGAIATLFSADMTLLARSYRPEEFIGSDRSPNPALVALVRQRGGTARFVSRIDNVERIHAAAPVPGTEWTTLVSLPTAPIDKAVRQSVVRWLRISGLAAVASFLLAYLAAVRMARPLLDIAAVAEKIADGETTARAQGGGNTEVTLLASAFNRMMDGLRRQQEELAESEERYHNLFARSKAVMLLVAPEDGRIVDANDAASRYYGYDAPALKTLEFKELTEAPADLLAEWMEQAAADQCNHFFARQRLSGGELRDVEVHAGPMEVNGRELLYCIVHDVTERKALEEKLRRINQDLEQFAYVVSHDLRQPLRMVTSYLGLIQRQMGASLDGELKTFFDFACGGAKRMDRLILDMLEYSRTGRHSEPKPMSLATAVNDALLYLQPAIEDAKARVSIGTDLPTIVGDPAEMTRLFQNLIGNAIKYRSPARSPEIEIGCLRQGKEWLISVRDNGIGIAAKDQERVFGIFQQLAPADARQGTGIGLAICKKIVEHHGGRIWIDSEPDRGSTFLVALPVAENKGEQP